MLSGKYTHGNADQVKAGRGERVTAFLNERTYAIVDELLRIGRELGANPAAVALAWVQSRPGVASTIIGARTLDQLEQNLLAADLTLTSEQIAALDRVSEPTLNCPTPALKTMASAVMHAGATVNGEPSELLPLWREDTWATAPPVPSHELLDITLLSREGFRVGSEGPLGLDFAVGSCFGVSFSFSCLTQWCVNRRSVLETRGRRR